MFKTLTPFLSIVMGIVIFFFLTKPMFAEVEAIKSQTTQYREAVERAEESNGILQGLLQKRNSFSAQELERLDTLVPESINEVRLLVDLEALAKKHNILFGNIEITKGEGSEANLEEEDSLEGIAFDQDFNYLDVSFDVISSYDQFKVFLTDIEKSLTLMEVTNVSFSVLSGELQQYEIVVRIYSLAKQPVE